MAHRSHEVRTMTPVLARSVSAAEKQQYQRDGYIVIRSLLSEEQVERAAVEAADLLLRYQNLMTTGNLRCRWQPNVLTGECAFETFDPIIDLSPACRELVLDEGLLGVLAGLYGEPACLFKDKLIYKPPGLKGYDLHQDWIGWPGFPRSFLTVLVALDPAARDNGATEVFGGYHHNGSLTPEDGDYHPLPTELIDESRGVMMELQPGDVGIFTGFTPHRSAPNLSDRWRRQLYLSYNKLSDGGAQRERHYQEFHVWLKKKYAEYGKTETYFE
jgi:ectoine hydroxylase-related dioxygenase (phytanoyl-CoA dioxygenase family)